MGARERERERELDTDRQREWEQETERMGTRERETVRDKGVGRGGGGDRNTTETRLYKMEVLINKHNVFAYLSMHQAPTSDTAVTRRDSPRTTMTGIVGAHSGSGLYLTYSKYLWINNTLQQMECTVLSYFGINSTLIQTENMPSN